MSANPIAPARLCRHCHAAIICRPRGLCWVCYHTQGIRDLYTATSKYGRRGVGNGDDARPLAPLPTAALPGTNEKLAVLEERARLNLRLWHPLDARADEE